MREKHTTKDILFKHWKAWWEKDPDSKNMDLEMGIFEQEQNEALQWILPAMNEWAAQEATEFSEWCNLKYNFYFNHKTESKSGEVLWGPKRGSGEEQKYSDIETRELYKRYSKTKIK